MEIIFLSYDVRFIAINDIVDSANAVNEMSGIRNYFNDFYAADTSKKNRAVQRAKGQRGERISTVIPYGYLKNPEYKGNQKEASAFFCHFLTRRCEYCIILVRKILSRVNMNNNERISKATLFLFDMDGTLYLGNRLYSFTKELLSTIRGVGKDYMFMTNNSSKSVNDYIKKLKGMGIDAKYDDFLTSSQATAYYLKKHHEGKRLYVCGTESLKDELRSEGFEITNILEDVDVIVMGFDTELTFQKLHDVSKLLLTRKDIPYIATNPDYVCPTEFGSVPDCGSVCDMLYNVSKRRPFVIGKPEAIMPMLAMEKRKRAPSETAVVGDRIYTDIKSGINAGALTILVMSGETTREILEESSDKPDIVLESAEEILNALKYTDRCE